MLRYGHFYHLSRFWEGRNAHYSASIQATVSRTCTYYVSAGARAWSKQDLRRSWRRHWTPSLSFEQFTTRCVQVRLTHLNAATGRRPKNEGLAAPLDVESDQKHLLCRVKQNDAGGPTLTPRSQCLSPNSLQPPNSQSPRDGPAIQSVG
jgi:hypothetical protein